MAKSQCYNQNQVQIQIKILANRRQNRNQFVTVALSVLFSIAQQATKGMYVVGVEFVYCSAVRQHVPRC